MKATKWLWLAVALLISPLARADDYTALKLYKSCHDPRGSPGFLACVGYIHGLLDGMIAGKVAGKEYCPPKDGVGVDEARLIIEKFMQDRPEQLNGQAAFGASFAMLKAFPCKSN